MARYKLRTTVLAAIAAGLFAFITLYERHTLSRLELEGRSDRLVERFVRSQVDEVRVVRSGQDPIVLLRVAEGMGGVGQWELSEPTQGPADNQVVGSFLGVIEWSDAMQSFLAQDGDLSRFGLDAPRITVSLKHGGDTTELWIGDAEESGRGVYITSDEGNTVQVAGLDVFEAIDQEASDFRSKRLFERGVLTATELVVFPQNTQRIVLRQNTGNWSFGNASSNADSVRFVIGEWAVQSRVEQALRTLGDLEATSFLPNEVVSEAGRELVNASRPAGDDEDYEGQVVLSVQAQEPAEQTPCGGTWIVALINDEPVSPVACVSQRAFDALSFDASWIDARPLSLAETDVTSIRLEVNGELETVVARDEGGEWAGSMDVDAQAIGTWLRDLRRTSMLPDAAEFAPLAATSVDTSAEPLTRLSLSGPEHSESISIFSTRQLGDAATSADAELFRSLRRQNERRDSGAWVFRTRDGEEDPYLYPAPLELTELLSNVQDRLRTRSVFSSPGLISLRVFGVALDGTQVEQTLLKEDDLLWQMTSPVEARADMQRSALAEQALSSIRAREWVGDELPEYGLNDTRTLRVDFRVPTEDGRGADHELALGAEAPGDGLYARFDEGDVFVVSAGLRGLLEVPLLSGTIFAVPRYEIEEATLDFEGQTRSARLEGGQFIDADGTPIGADQEEGLTIGLGRLRGRALRFGQLPEGAEVGSIELRVADDAGLAHAPSGRLVVLLRRVDSGYELQLEGVNVVFTAESEVVDSVIEAL